MKFYILLVSFFVTATCFAAREIPIFSKRTLKQRVDLYVELLNKETDKAKDRKEMFEAVKNAKAQVRNLTDESLNTSEQDHLFTEVLMTGLQSLPNNKQFKVSNCESYRQDLQKLTERWEKSPLVDEGLKPAQDFLQSVCL